MIKILFVEDNKDLAESIKTYLELVGYAVLNVVSGLEFYKALAVETYDVAIIDINLPDQSGLILAEYTRNNTDMGIIILTAQDNVETRIQSYGAGSDIFMSKPTDCRELDAAIRSVVDRLKKHPQTATPSDSWILDSKKRLLKDPSMIVVKLTAKETNLLKLLGNISDGVVSRESLLVSLYQVDNESSSQALDTLISRTRKKIQAATANSESILSEYGVGFSFCSKLHIV